MQIVKIFFCRVVKNHETSSSFINFHLIKCRFFCGQIFLLIKFSKLFIRISENLSRLNNLYLILVTSMLRINKQQIFLMMMSPRRRKRRKSLLKSPRLKRNQRVTMFHLMKNQLQIKLRKN